VQVRRHDRGTQWIVLNARAARTADRRILSIEGVMTDITERKQAERARERLLSHEQEARAAAEAAARAKEELLSLLSHDLRTPLTTIKASAQLLRRQTGRAVVPMTDVAEGLARIEAGAARMDRMIEELLDLARLEMGALLEVRLQLTDLVPLLSQAIEEHQQLTDRHALRLETSVSELKGIWDADRLERVFANLLSNAIKYSPDGGTVTVTVEAEVEEDGATWALVGVRDEGVGIPAADLPHLFTRFYRATNVTGRISGNGIGLAGAKQIVDQQGGTLDVESTEGAGTTVSVRLPLRPTSAPSPTAA
jgi:signal transduction histidine kinase